MSNTTTDNSTITDRTCKQCGISYTLGVEGTGYKYCSRECMKQSKRNWDRNPDNKVKRHLYYVELRYGVKPAEFKAMLATQNGLCAICKNPINGGGMRNHQRQLDHCHNTGKPRGILCARCNTGLANLNDDPVLLREAIKYLEK